jgi:hypothetical protein
LRNLRRLEGNLRRHLRSDLLSNQLVGHPLMTAVFHDQPKLGQEAITVSPTNSDFMDNHNIRMEACPSEEQGCCLTMTFSLENSMLALSTAICEDGLARGLSGVKMWAPGAPGEQCTMGVPEHDIFLLSF